MICIDIRYQIKKDGKSWFIECLDYPVFTQGRTMEEAKVNLRDAFLLYAEDPDAQKIHPELREIASLIKYVPDMVLSTQMISPISMTFQVNSTYEPFANFIRKRNNPTPL